MRLRYLVLFVVVAISIAKMAFAGDTLTSLISNCDPREDYSLCVLKLQRDDAFDREAIARGQLARDRAYWAQYVAGLAEQRKVTMQGEAGMARRRDTLAKWWAQYVKGLSPPRRKFSSVTKFLSEDTWP